LFPGGSWQRRSNPANPARVGRCPKGLERMLLIYFMQHGFSLSVPGMEEALYDSQLLDDLLHEEGSGMG
jgi:hypothetical protein